MTQKLTLTRPQKAAAILVAMGKPAAGRLLKFFKQDELKSLIESARMLRTIPQAELEKIISEFESEFAEGAGLLDSADTIDTILSENLSPEEVSMLMGRSAPVTPTEGAVPVWVDLQKMPPEQLLEMISGEHPQTIAYVLSNLEPQVTARIVVGLEKTTRTEVVRRMLSINMVRPAAKQMIERQLRARLKAQDSVRDTSAGQARIAEILNELDKEQMDEVMRDLEASGAGDVAAIRARLFSFDDIVLLSQKSRVALFDGLATDIVTTALRDTAPDLREAVLSALGARSRRMIESELAAGAEGVTPEAVAAARKKIASSAVQLSQTGALELPSVQAAA